VLEWLLIIEVVVLAILSVLGLIGTFIGRNDRDDPIYRFCSTFWREFMWPPEVMSIDSTLAVPRHLAPTGPRSSLAEEEPSEEDLKYGRFRKGADGTALKTDMAVLVVPHAATDSVVGRDGDGLRVQVTGEAGDSRSNKALIELVANAIGVKVYQVTLTKGHYQPRKTVQIQGLSPDELQNKLADLAEAE
jgi:uncharacterized protein YggU (UPF0235/DUF167 family)